MDRKVVLTILRIVGVILITPLLLLLLGVVLLPFGITLFIFSLIEVVLVSLLGFAFLVAGVWYLFRVEEEDEHSSDYSLTQSKEK